jgi:histidinol-phosphate aminotransferase
MKNLALQRIQKMKRYNPPLSGRRAFSGMLLDFNERTLSPSPTIQKAILKLLQSDNLQLYPEYGDLENKLAKYDGVNVDQIMITNGSDQGIDLVFRTFTDAGDEVIIPTPSFAMFTQAAQVAGNKILRPLYNKENLSFPLEEVLGMVGNSTKLIVLCNPNNPTGTLLSLNEIEKIAKKAPNTIILVDEAYFEYSKVTAIPLIKTYPNIIVVRTFSKAFGLASLRIGYIIASSKYVNELLKVRGPYDLNIIAYTASLASLDDLSDVQTYASEAIDQAKPLVEEFFSKNNITFYKSAGNFLLYRPFVEEEAEILKENGILVRPQDKTNIKGALRLTIGTVNQMKRFIKIYQNVIINKSKTKKYAFIDRDGTLIFEPRDTFQIDSIEKLKVLEGVIQGLKELTEQGYELIMVSNQDGLGTTSFPKADFEEPQNKMLSIFEENGIKFTRIFICPHMASKNCGCRKPKTNLVNKLLKESLLDKSNSFVCGDREADKLFAKNLGIKFISMPTNGDFYKALAKGGIL